MVIIENEVLNSLGRVSYGVYLYHYPIIYLTILSLNTLGIPEDPGYSLLLYSGLIFLIIGLSLITYRRFETPFLKIKERFAVVRTKRWEDPKSELYPGVYRFQIYQQELLICFYTCLAGFLIRRVSNMIYRTTPWRGVILILILAESLKPLILPLQSSPAED